MSRTTSARAFPELSVFSMGRFDIPMASEYASNSCVLQAWDKHLERQVALKYSIDPLLVRAIENDEIARRDPRVQGVFERAAAATRRYNLHREARLLALIDHPNVIPVIDIGRFDEGLIGLLMPWLDGGTVADRDFSGSWEGVLDDALEIGRGVAAIHEAGLLHRDLKPRNILFDRSGRPRVADLGLACLIENSSAMAERVGTRAYMPPGVFENGFVDVRDDLYAYCLIVYEMFYGVLPFADPDARGPIPRPKRPGGMPRRLHAILARGLAEDPDDRWPNMPTLLSQMKAVGQPERRLRRAWVAVGGLGLAASFTVGMFASEPTVLADACDGVDRELEPAWSEDVRGELRGAFGTRKVGDGLQEWAKRWYETRTQECEAAKAEDAEIVATACSASVRARFLATVHAFRTPHLRAGLRFAAVIADLPAPEHCLDHPDDGEWGYGGLLELRDIDVEVQALAKMEDLHAAWERQRVYMELALELDSKHGLARAIFWRGELRRLEGDLDGASTDFGLAYAQAWELGLGVFGAEVQMKQAAVAGAKGELAAVDAYASSASGVFETYRPERVAEVLQVQGLAWVTGPEDDARGRGLALLGRAVELREVEVVKFPGTRERLSQAHESYARGLLAVGRAPEAVEYLDLALDVHQDEYGHGTWRTRRILRQKFLTLVAMNKHGEAGLVEASILSIDHQEQDWRRYVDDASWLADEYVAHGDPSRALRPLHAARKLAHERGMVADLEAIDGRISELKTVEFSAEP